MPTKTGNWTCEDVEEYAKCPSCGGDMRSGAYICNYCAATKKMPTPRLVADKPEYTPPKRFKKGGDDGGLCSKCPKEKRCRERVRLGLWLLCEIPDERDIMRARAIQLGVAA